MRYPYSVCLDFPLAFRMLVFPFCFASLIAERSITDEARQWSIEWSITYLIDRELLDWSMDWLIDLSGDELRARSIIWYTVSYTNLTLPTILLV